LKNYNRFRAQGCKVKAIYGPSRSEKGVRRCDNRIVEKPSILCILWQIFLVPARPPYSAWQEGGLVGIRF
jgi:hypothetical protein